MPSTGDMAMYAAAAAAVAGAALIVVAPWSSGEVAAIKSSCSPTESGARRSEVDAKTQTDDDRSNGNQTENGGKEDEHE